MAYHRCIINDDDNLIEIDNLEAFDKSNILIPGVKVLHKGNSLLGDVICVRDTIECIYDNGTSKLYYFSNLIQLLYWYSTFCQIGDINDRPVIKILSKEN